MKFLGFGWSWLSTASFVRGSTLTILFLEEVVECFYCLHHNLGFSDFHLLVWLPITKTREPNLTSYLSPSWSEGKVDLCFFNGISSNSIERALVRIWNWLFYIIIPTLFSGHHDKKSPLHFISQGNGGRIICLPTSPL